MSAKRPVTVKNTLILMADLRAEKNSSLLVKTP
jgi:hypothetical protein